MDTRDDNRAQEDIPEKDRQYRMVCALPIDLKTAREKLSGSNRHAVRI